MDEQILEQCVPNFVVFILTSYHDLHNVVENGVYFRLDSKVYVVCNMDLLHFTFSFIAINKTLYYAYSIR